MKAMRFHEFGGPEVLRYEDVEQPTPGAGQVRIRVVATSFNGVEVAQRGPLAELPAVHADAAAGTLPSGKVVIVGPNA